MLKVAAIHLPGLMFRIGSLNQRHEVATDDLCEFTRRSLARIQRRLHPVSTNTATPRFVDSKKLSGHIINLRRCVQTKRESLQISLGFPIQLIVLIVVDLGVDVDRSGNLRARFPISFVEHLLGDDSSNDFFGFPARFHQALLRHISASLQSRGIQQKLARASNDIRVVFQRSSHRARHRGDFGEEHVSCLFLPEELRDFLRWNNLEPGHPPIRRRQPRGHQHARLRYCRGCISGRRMQQKLLNVGTTPGGCARACG